MGGKRTPMRCTTFVQLLATLATPTLAFAQDPSELPAEPTAAPVVEAPAGPRLPQIRRGVPPVWPIEALAAGQTATVRLEVDVDERGDVIDARVVEGAGDAFDRAAIQAALSTVFDPALDAAGQPATARIGYAVTFDPAFAVPRSIEGHVRDADGRPVDGAVVILKAEGQEPYKALPDAVDGAWAVAGLPPGDYAVTVVAPGWSSLAATANVTPGVVGVADFALVPSVDGVSKDTIIVELVRPNVTVVERALSADEIRVLPGSGGDVIKAVTNLPGIARPPFGIGLLVVRGTAPEDTAFYLDGARIPLVFHFAGFSTVMNGDLLSQVVFQPGGYGVRFGRTMGGAIDLQTDTKIAERPESYASLDLLQATLFVEQKIGDRTLVSLSGRRSYADAILNPVFKSLAAQPIRAPRYYDWQARVLHEWRRGDRFQAMFFGSDDRFVILGEDGEDQQAAFGLYLNFQKLFLRWDHPLPGGWNQETTFIFGPETQRGAFFGGEVYEKPTLAVLREEFRKDAPSRGVGLRAGADVLAAQYRYLYQVPGIIDKEAKALGISPSPYAEATVRWDGLTVVPGIRVDPWFLDTDYAAVTVDPRVSLAYEPSDALVLRAGVGQYSQFPLPDQILKDAGGDPDLGPQHALQWTVGGKWAKGPLSVETTTFCTQLSDLVVGQSNPFRFTGGGPPAPGEVDDDGLANDGTGDAYGVDLLVKYQTPTTVAWLSGTWSRSFRTERPGQDAIVYRYDQPIVMTLLATHKFGEKWRLGGRVRYGSGNPYTPVVNRTYDADSGSFEPVYGDPWSRRVAPYWQIDARVDRTWRFAKWQLSTYLDVQNLTNRQNVEIMNWNYDYSAEDPIAGFPVFPSFGVEGRWGFSRSR